MAFPTTGTLDNFNDTENPMTGWAQILDPGSFPFRFSSNGTYAEQNDSNAHEYWSATTFGPDSTGVEVWAEFTAVSDDTGTFSLWLAYASLGSLNVDGYALSITKTAGAGNDSWQLVSVTNASPTNIGTALTQELSAGDSVGVEKVGNVFTIYYKASGGSWTSLGTRTDESNLYTGSPNIGMGSSAALANNWRINNFGGGTLVAGAPQPSAGRIGSRLRPSAFSPGLAR